MAGAIAIIGARGFVGRRFVERFGAMHELVLFGRTESKLDGHPVRRWSPGADLRGVSTVIHLAADASTLKGGDYNATNVDLPLEVLEASAKAGVRRFVFVSSIFVHGRSAAEPLTPDAPFAPEDGYARSKVDAEHMLTRRSAELGLHLVVVRPPLVYGAEARNTLARLRKLVARRMPRPFGRATGKRSMIAVNNLVDCLLAVAKADTAIACILPADASDMSLRELVTSIADATGTRVVNLPVPKRLLRRALTVLGRRHIYDQLFSSLCVDRAHWRALGWAPATTTESAIAQELS